MENLDEEQQLPTLQERFQFMISQEPISKVHQSLCELISSLMSYFKMTHQERLESMATRLNQEHEDNWKRLNLEIPGKEEYKAVTKILKTQTELLQQNFNPGRDTSRLLLALLRSLWKYFVFNSQRRPALTPNFASLNNHSECEEFIQAILRLSTNLQRNTLEPALEQDVKMIIHHLKESTAVWGTQDSQSTSEDQELDILDAHPVL